VLNKFGVKQISCKPKILYPTEGKPGESQLCLSRFYALFLQVFWVVGFFILFIIFHGVFNHNFFSVGHIRVKKENIKRL